MHKITVFTCARINRRLLHGMREFKWVLMLGSDTGKLIKHTLWVNSKIAVALLISSVADGLLSRSQNS